MRSWIFGQKNQDESQEQSKNDGTNQNDGGPQQPAEISDPGSNTG